MARSNGNPDKAEQAPTLDERKGRLRKLLTQPAVVTLVRRAVPPGVLLDPLRLLWQALQLIETPDDQGVYRLMSCTNESIVRAVLKCASVGLEFTQGQAYLIPYGDQASCDFGVWGYVSIADRSGKVKRIWSDVVYESDPFRIVRGERPVLEHDITGSWALPGSNTPIGESAKQGVALDKGGRGLALGAYACCELLDGTVRWEAVPEAVLTVIRQQARSKDSPSHKRFGDDMRRKIAVKRAAKLWPRGVVDHAIEAEENERMDHETERQIVETTVAAEGGAPLAVVPVKVEPSSSPATAEREPSKPAQEAPSEQQDGPPALPAPKLDPLSEFLKQKKAEPVPVGEPEDAIGGRK
jgi:recombinational DNA repair protein RecT